MLPLDPKPPSDAGQLQPGTPCPIESRIAPYRGGTSLKDLQFETVTLNDLTAGGFSFWISLWPKYAEIVFPLVEPGEGMVLAHIRKVERVGGRYLVRCQFVRRLSDD